MAQDRAQDRKTPGWLKFLLEFGPVLLFFIGYSRWKDETFTLAGNDYSGFVVITALFVPLMVATTLALWALTGKLSRMQLVTLVLVVIFGGLTVWLNDETFFKMKPSIIYALFAIALGIGLLRGESWLASLMGEVLPMRHEGWMILTKRMALFFLFLAVLNEVIWRTLSTDTWVNFKTFGLPLALFAFIMTQGGMVSKYALPKDDDKA